MSFTTRLLFTLSGLLLESWWRQHFATCTRTKLTNVNTKVGHCCLFYTLFLFALSGNFVSVLATSRCLFDEMCTCASVYVCACASQREIETWEEWAAIYSKRRRRVGGRGVRVCAIEQPPVMRGSMLTRMVSNTAWGTVHLPLALNPHRSSVFPRLSTSPSRLERTAG